MSIVTVVACDRCGSHSESIQINYVIPQMDVTPPTGWIAYQRGADHNLSHCCTDCLHNMEFFT